ncbi:oxidoreductase [Blastopirellula sp. JC732]|uniref:Oxidoreductase n=1 Tax=Blastopirellula sediminis TaxID=2894196 RepID=A0A9X1SF48_9BACT|nr:proton-conducting transporter membrane subunit [Blastopirellula sediminis]MCC9608488.1 oxidoreductase [Blastopirellula sediminis]MCC9628735.1 oxidoreductase [Blastopirellula sediminis]
MAELHAPWLELAVLVTLAGSILTAAIQDRSSCQRVCLAICIVAQLLALGGCVDFFASGADAGSFAALGSLGLVIDDLSSPLIPLAALQFLLTVLSTLKTKVGRFSFSAALFSEGIAFALLGCLNSPGILMLLIVGAIPLWMELRLRRQSTRVYTFYFSLFAALLIAGEIVSLSGSPVWGGALTTAAILLRCGVVPLHGWAADLIERASFGSALLTLTLMPGVYAMARLVLPEAPAATLQVVAILSLITAAYAASMALVQTEARRFFAYLFLSNSSLVLVGLSAATPISMTGAMCAWISIQLALTGLGITLRCVEARIGRISLSEYHGFYDHMPMLAALFLITGLASIGFPGTIGFIAGEILIDGVVTAYPIAGILAAAISALNGIAILKVYFRIFNGRSRVVYYSIGSRPAERFAISIIAALIIAGGLFPQLGMSSCFRAAQHFVQRREENFGAHPPHTTQHAAVSPAATHPRE